MRTRTKVISLVFLTTLYGCTEDTDPNANASLIERPAQRDVYHSIAECMVDWGNKDLCIEAEKVAVAQQATTANSKQHASGGTSVIFLPTFHGPEYYHGERIAYANGRTITPNAAPSRAVSSFTQTMPSQNFRASRDLAVANGTAGPKATTFISNRAKAMASANAPSRPSAASSSASSHSRSSVIGSAGRSASVSAGS